MRYARPLLMHMSQEGLICSKVSSEPASDDEVWPPGFGRQCLQQKL